MTRIDPTDKVRSVSAGPSVRNMICSACGRPFRVVESSWAAAERKACPNCGSRLTTPVFESRH